MVMVRVRVGVAVRVEVGVNVLVGVEAVFFTGPQADTNRLNPNIIITDICFPMFILPPASILYAMNLLNQLATADLSASQNTRFS